MQFKEIEAAIEALLFASGEAVTLDKISDVLGICKSAVLDSIEKLSERLSGQESGIKLISIDNKYQLCSKEAYADHIRSLMDVKRNTPLSMAAMEVLAIICYNQPVTKAFVEQIRGVDCSGVIGSLIVKGLVEERGRLDLPGKPLLYGITDNFLRCFNISNLDELPLLPDAQEVSDDNRQAL